VLCKLTLTSHKKQTDALVKQRLGYSVIKSWLSVKLCIRCIQLFSATEESLIYEQYLGASRHAIQHIWCLSQATINRSRKGIWCKIGEMMEVGASMAWMGWCPARLLAHLLLLFSACLIISRMMTRLPNKFQV